MRLARSSQSLKWKCIEAKSWSYFPFDLMSSKTWNSFYEIVWKSKNVQLLLDYKMEAWCSNSHLPAWESGSDLWQYSSTDAFWNHERHEKSESILQEHPEILWDWRVDYWDEESDSDDDDSEMLTEFYASSVYDEVWKATEPAPNSLRAQLMHGGANQLAAVMKQVALAIFDQGIVIKSGKLWNHNQKVSNQARSPGEELLCIVPKYKYIIDFNRLETVKIELIWKHVDLKGTDVESYQDCGISVEEVEYERQCEEWDCEECENCTESDDDEEDIS